LRSALFVNQVVPHEEVQGQMIDFDARFKKFLPQRILVSAADVGDASIDGFKHNLKLT